MYLYRYQDDRSIVVPPSATVATLEMAVTGDSCHQIPSVFPSGIQYFFRMVPDPSPSTTVSESETDHSSNTLISVLLGASVGVLLSFIPFSTLLGGAIAGYLAGGEPKDGLRVGALAGAIMCIPIALFSMGLGLYFGFVTGVAPIAFGFAAIFLLGISALYTVGLGALGGYLGIYLQDEL